VIITNDGRCDREIDSKMQHLQHLDVTFRLSIILSIYMKLKVRLYEF